MTDAKNNREGEEPDVENDEAWGFLSEPPPETAAAHPPLGSGTQSATGLRPISPEIAAAVELYAPPEAIAPVTVSPPPPPPPLQSGPRRDTDAGLGVEQPGAPVRLDTVPAGGTVSLNGVTGNAMLTIRPTKLITLVDGTELGYEEFAAAASTPPTGGDHTVDLTADALPPPPRVPSTGERRTAYRPPPMPDTLSGDATNPELDLSKLVAMAPRGIIRDHSAQEPARIPETAPPELTPPPSVEPFPDPDVSGDNMFIVPGAVAPDDPSAATPVDAEPSFFLDSSVLEDPDDEPPEVGFHESGSLPIQPDALSPPVREAVAPQAPGGIAFALLYVALSSRPPAAQPAEALVHTAQVSVPPLADFVDDPPTGEEAVTAERDVPTLVPPSPPPWWRFRWTHLTWWTLPRLTVVMLITGFIIGLAIVLIQRGLEWYYGV